MIRKETSAISEISGSRTILMGIFMLIIMLFHNSYGILGMAGKITGIYGHWGVDVFLFLSGFGLYHSLSRSKQTPLFHFYVKRAIRIIPAAVMVGSILYLLQKASFLGCFGLNLWYIRTLLILYLLTPVFYYLLRRYSPLLILAAVLISISIALLLLIPMMKDCAFSSMKVTLLWTLARMPAFVIGMFFYRVDWSTKKWMNPIFLFLLLPVLYCVLYFHRLRAIEGALSNNLHLLPYIALAIIIPSALVIFCTLILRHIPIFFKQIFNFIGTISLELYLVHEAIFSTISGLPYSGILKFTMAYTFSLIAAVAIHYIFSKINLIPSNGKKATSLN